MRILLCTFLGWALTIGCAGGGGGGVSQKPGVARHQEGATKMPNNEQINPRSDSADAGGIPIPTNPGDPTIPSNGGGGVPTIPTGGNVPTGTGGSFPDVGSIPTGIPCAIGQACKSQEALIQHCQKKIIIPNC